jgi:hypothetical protein
MTVHSNLAVKYLATTESKLPLLELGNISDPMVNTVGTLPPIPSPAITRQAIKVSVVGIKLEAIPAVIFIPREYKRRRRRPN